MRRRSILRLYRNEHDFEHCLPLLYRTNLSSGRYHVDLYLQLGLVPKTIGNAVGALGSDLDRPK